MRLTVPPLSATDVHVWTVPVAAADKFDPDSMLAAEECERADRFRFEADRARYVAGRCAARLLLAAYAGVADPATLRFVAGPHGKPALESPGPLHFNWSHAGDLAVVAITQAGDVGVDVEEIGRFADLDAVAQRVFSAVELAEYQALDSEARRRAFFNAWTRKEAFIKATGEGMTRPLQGFDVVLVPGEPPAIRRIEDAGDDTSRWSLHAFEPMPGYVAAVAVRAPGITPHYLSWPEPRP